MPIEGFFPTPVYYSTVNNLENIQKELSKAYKHEKDNNKFGRPPLSVDTNHTVSDPTFSESIIENYKLKHFKKEVESHIDEYISSLGSIYKKYKICNCWFTNTEKGEYTIRHNHSPLDISGVYYFKTNGEDGSIEFYNPHLIHTTVIYGYQKLSERVFHKPAIGKIILFPSWLEHRVSENKTEDNRISVAFNINFKRYD